MLLPSIATFGSRIRGGRSLTAALQLLADRLPLSTHPPDAAATPSPPASGVCEPGSWHSFLSGSSRALGQRGFCSAAALDSAAAAAAAPAASSSGGASTSAPAAAPAAFGAGAVAAGRRSGPTLIQTHRRAGIEQRDGIVHVYNTFNNTIITLTDTAGAVKAWTSGGQIGAWQTSSIV